MKVLDNLELNKNQLIDALMQKIAGDHASPVEGIFWWDQTAHVMKVYDGTAIQSFALSGASGVSANTWDANSIVKADTDNTPVALVMGPSTLLARLSTGAIVAATPAQILTELLAADGAGSLFDADKLDAQEGSYYLDLANATGTTTAAKISDFNTAVRTNRLDQMATPTASVAFGSQKITGLADGSNAADGATYGQLLAVIEGKKWKDPVRAASTTDLTLSGTQTIDGVAVVAGDRVLAAGQTAAAASGIYVVAAGAWARATDADLAAEYNNATVIVQGGTANGGDVYTQTANIGTLDTTSMVWVKTGEGNQTYSADGTTLNLTGNTFSVPNGGITGTQLNASVAGAGLTGGGGSALAVGAGTGVTVGADTVGIDTAVVARKFTTTCAAATSTVVTHNLGTRDVEVQVYRATTPWDQVLCDNERTDTNNVTVLFAVAPSAGDYRIVVIG